MFSPFLYFLPFVLCFLFGLLFVHYEHLPNPEKADKTDNFFIDFRMLEDICEFCFLQRIVGKYPPHPALFLFSDL